jgi:hypothetical protein
LHGRSLAGTVGTREHDLAATRQQYNTTRL